MTPTLVVGERRHKMTWAMLVPREEADCASVARRAAKFVDELGHGEVTIRCTSELASHKHDTSVVRQSQRPATGERQSNGMIERSIGLACGQTYLMNRCAAGSDGKTWSASDCMGNEAKRRYSDFWVTHITCAQMFVCGSQCGTARLCVWFVKTVGCGTPRIPCCHLGSSTQLDCCPSLALPAVCLLDCHRPPTWCSVFCLWAVVGATGLAPWTIVGFNLASGLVVLGFCPRYQ